MALWITMEVKFIYYGIWHCTLRCFQKYNGTTMEHVQQTQTHNFCTLDGFLPTQWYSCIAVLQKNTDFSWFTAVVELYLVGFILTRLKSDRNVMRVPSACLNSTVIMSFSLSASNSSSVIWPSLRRTSTVNCEQTLTDNTRVNTTNAIWTEAGKVTLAFITKDTKDVNSFNTTMGHIVKVNDFKQITKLWTTNANYCLER